MPAKRVTVVARTRAAKPARRAPSTRVLKTANRKNSKEFIVRFQDELTRLGVRIVSQPHVMVLVVVACALTFHSVLGLSDPYTDITENVKTAGYTDLATKMTTYRKRALGVLWAAACATAVPMRSRTIVALVLLGSIFLLKARAAYEYALLATAAFVFCSIADNVVRIAAVAFALLSLYLSRP